MPDSCATMSWCVLLDPLLGPRALCGKSRRPPVQRQYLGDPAGLTQLIMSKLESHRAGGHSLVPTQPARRRSPTAPHQRTHLRAAARTGAAGSSAKSSSGTRRRRRTVSADGSSAFNRTGQQVPDSVRNRPRPALKPDTFAFRPDNRVKGREKRVGWMDESGSPSAADDGVPPPGPGRGAGPATEATALTTVNDQTAAPLSEMVSMAQKAVEDGTLPAAAGLTGPNPTATISAEREGAHFAKELAAIQATLDKAERQRSQHARHREEVGRGVIATVDQLQNKNARLARGRPAPSAEDESALRAAFAAKAAELRAFYSRPAAPAAEPTPGAAAGEAQRLEDPPAVRALKARARTILSEN